LGLLRNSWGGDFESDFSERVSRDGESFSLDEDDISVVTLDKKVLGVAIGIAVLDLFGDVVTSIDGEGVVNLDRIFEDVFREQVNVDVDFTSSSSSIGEFNSQGVTVVSWQVGNWNNTLTNKSTSLEIIVETSDNDIFSFELLEADQILEDWFSSRSFRVSSLVGSVTMDKDKVAGLLIRNRVKSSINGVDNKSTNTSVAGVGTATGGVLLS